MKMPLKVQSLKKVYGGEKPFVAVDGISFELKEGEILGLLGPNGSGKTTTIQMLLGTLTPSEGEISYFGKELGANRSEILQQVSFASTYTSLPYLLTVEENLLSIGLLYGIAKGETRRRVEPLLKQFGIWEKWRAPVSSLSAGQVTRLMLVKAFFIEPKVVLLDEPTASLDPDVAQEVCDFLHGEREKRGVSILFTSHKMKEVAELCDRTIFLKGGKIVADDVPERLAKSVSSFRLRLVVSDGMKRTVAVAEGEGVAFAVEHRAITLSLDEEEIPPFLQKLAERGVVYSSIRIEEPSLEEYFFHLTERGR